MIKQLKSVAGGAFVFGFAALLMIATVLLLQGTARAATWLLPPLATVAGRVTFYGLPLLAVTAFIGPTRKLAAYGFVVTTWTYATAIWLWVFLYTLQVWGWAGVIIGLVMGGVGVLPVAMIAALLYRNWAVVGGFTGGFTLMLGAQLAAAFVMTKADERKVRLANSQI